MINHFSFDLETAKPIPDFSKWREHVPLGVSCASSYWFGGRALWYAGKTQNTFTPKMSESEKNEMIETIFDAMVNGYTIVSFNGAGFDFHMLYLETQDSEIKKKIREIAYNHVDMMFHFYTVKGYPIGLDKMSKSIGLSGKTEGMHGDLAPELWQKGEYEKVLEYVSDDGRLTYDSYRIIMAQNGFSWISNSGYNNTFILENNKWMTVDECLRIPEFHPKWMREPLMRKDMVGWLDES